MKKIKSLVMKIYKIAIDGPAGVGKSTTADKLAEKLNFDRINSGEIYRALTYHYIHNHGEVLNLEKLLNDLNSIKITFKDQKYHLNDQNIHDFLHSHQIDNLVSDIAKIKEIREKAKIIQHELIEDCKNGVIMDGRDIGTVVMPDADLKIFLTADAETRAYRRLNQTGGDYKQILVSIKNRDYIDINREIAPLAPANDSIHLDNTNMGIDEVVERIYKIFTEKV